jgi:hypothetical protein
VHLRYCVSLVVCLTAAAQQVTAPKQSITVEAQAPKVEAGATTSSSVTADQSKALPTRSANVRDALPLIPGVVRTPEGKLVISGGPEHRSALLVNSVDVTDPATGRFGVTVPIDIIERLNVYKTPFLAEYGRFTSGVVAVETERGGDEWRYELNDPTPELRIRSGHIHGVRGFTPRLSGGGPVIRDRLWFAGAGEFALRKRPTYPLPFPYNEEKSQSVNAHVQLDWAASAKHLVGLTLHGVPQKSNFVGLGFYTPQPAAPSYRGHEYRSALSDRFSTTAGLLESTIAVGQVVGKTGAQGSEPLTLAPDTSYGNYYFRQERRANRLQWIETFSATRGAHHLKAGGAFTYTRLDGVAAASSVRVQGLDEGLLGVTTFSNVGPYRLTDRETSLFVQDGWEPRRNLRFDVGVRGDYQRIAGVWRAAPRIGAAWTPWAESGPTLRAGYGWFFDRVPLNVFAFDRFPMWNGLPNVLESRGLAPRSDIWNAQIEQRLGPLFRLRLNYIDNRSKRLPVVAPGVTATVLRAHGTARSQQFEAIGRLSYRSEQEWLVSYVYNRTRGNLNDFTNFVGDFPVSVLRPDVFATVPGNIPHRFLTWGVFPMRYGIRMAPMIEWRTGFPYVAVDERQRYAGVPNSLRFPPFFSLDVRASKDVPFRNHKFRLSFSLFNATNHGNYDAIRLNTVDPQFGELLGQRPRRFRLDFDWLF